MGIEIDRDQFAPEEFRRFEQRLDRCLDALEALLSRPGFGRGPRSLGAELEVALVDADCRPLPLNGEVLRRTLDPRMTYELDRFNLECNLRHAPLAERPFEHLRQELESARRELSRAADAVGGRIVTIGILPTLTPGDLEPDAMTDSPRFRALSRALRAAREGPFQLRIDGEDPLQLACEDVTYEGAATSLQVHLRVDPDDFERVFNAAQLATAPVLAAAVNSPTFLGHRLWQEARVALFKQAVDARDEADRRQRRRARVGLGGGWVRGGVLELFRDAVHLFPPLLPKLSDEDPDACLRKRGVPKLEEIRLHQGTVWHWNRPVYDPADGGHLRIELRALPAGPGVPDMLANVAFLIGLTLGLAPEMDEVARGFDFGHAHHGFYRAAREGLDAELSWPPELVGDTAPTPVPALLPRLLPIAARGLREAGVADEEATPLLEQLLLRAERGRTGAGWQREALAAFERTGLDRAEALAAMLARYLELSEHGGPVSGWPLP